MKRQIFILILVFCNYFVTFGQNKSTKAAYSRLIKKADSLYFIGDCKAASDTFKIASELIKKEFYAQSRINEIESCMSIPDTVESTCPCKNKPTIIYTNREVLLEFIRSFVRIDSAIFVNDYKKAQSILSKTDCNKLQDRYISEIRNIQIDLEFANSMKLGDESFAQNDFQKAVAEYNRACSIKPAEILPRQRIKECNEIIATQHKFYALIKHGDDLLSKNDYKAALEKYEEAIKLYPNDQSLKDKIESTKQLIDKK